MLRADLRWPSLQVLALGGKRGSYPNRRANAPQGKLGHRPRADNAQQIKPPSTFGTTKSRMVQGSLAPGPGDQNQRTGDGVFWKSPVKDHSGSSAHAHAAAELPKQAAIQAGTNAIRKPRLVEELLSRPERTCPDSKHQGINGKVIDLIVPVHAGTQGRVSITGCQTRSRGRSHKELLQLLTQQHGRQHGAPAATEPDHLPPKPQTPEDACMHNDDHGDIAAQEHPIQEHPIQHVSPQQENGRQGTQHGTPSDQQHDAGYCRHEDRSQARCKGRPSSRQQHRQQDRPSNGRQLGRHGTQERGHERGHHGKPRDRQRGSHPGRQLAHQLKHLDGHGHGKPLEQQHRAEHVKQPQVYVSGPAGSASTPAAVPSTVTAIPHPGRLPASQYSCLLQSLLEMHWDMPAGALAGLYGQELQLHMLGGAGSKMLSVLEVRGLRMAYTVP